MPIGFKPWPSRRFERVPSGGCWIFPRTVRSEPAGIDLLPDHATDDRRDFWKGELNRTEKRIGLTRVRDRVLEYCDNNASLVFGCDWRVPPCCSERREYFALTSHWREEEQPFREERWPEVDRRYSRPIENTLA